MRPFLIEHLQELIEDQLLGWEVGRWRQGGALHQGFVHPLVTTVVLRMSWPAVNRLDAVLHESHAQRGEPAVARGAERDTIVRVQHFRHSVLTKHSSQRLPRLFQTD